MDEHKQRASALGLSVDDYLFIYGEEEGEEEEEEEEDNENHEARESTPSDVRVPFFTKRKETKQLKKATRGISLSDPALTNSSDLLLEFFKDLNSTLSAQGASVPTQLLLPAPFQSVPQQMTADLSVSRPGSQTWKNRNRLAYVFGMADNVDQNPYAIPAGSTVTLYWFKTGSGVPKKYFFSTTSGRTSSSAFLSQEGTSSEDNEDEEEEEGEESMLTETSSKAFLGFGKSKKKKDFKDVRPFTLKATGLPGQDQRRILVIPEDLVERRVFSVLFPLSEASRTGSFLNADTIRASQGALLLGFGPDEMKFLAIVSIPPRFGGRSVLPGVVPTMTATGPLQFPTTPPPESPEDEEEEENGDGMSSGQLLGPGQEEEEDGENGAPKVKPYESEEITLILDLMNKTVADERIFASFLESVGEETVSRWQNQIGFYLGGALDKAKRHPDIRGIGRIGTRDLRITNLALLSETVRSGFLHMVNGTERYRKGITPQGSLAVAAALFQTASMLRWTVYGVLRKKPYAESLRKWKTKKGLMYFSLDKVADFPVELFVHDFTDVVKAEAARNKATRYVAPLKEFNMRLAEVVVGLGDSIWEKKVDGSVAVALVIRNFLLGEITINAFARYYQWPDELESAIFILVAAASALCKLAGMDMKTIKNTAYKTLTVPIDVEKLVAMQRDFRLSAEKHTEKRRTLPWRTLPASPTEAGNALSGI